MISRRQGARCLALVALLLYSAFNQADMVVTEDMQPWEVCGLCHGIDGVPAVAKFPVLAGQSADYIEKQLRDFRSRRRDNDGGQMQSVVTEIQEKDIALIAEYFAQQKRKLLEPHLSAEQFAEGEKIFESGTGNSPACSQCHQKTAAGQVGPILFGQHSAYLVKQLQDFKSGARSNDSGAIMRSVATQLSEGDMQKVADFLQMKTQ